MPTVAQKPETHEDKVAALTAEVEALRRQLRHTQRLAAVGTMTAMVAHEFNNILTPIINYAQLAKSNPAMTEKAIARAFEGGERASEICNALLGLTRDQPIVLREENLADLIDEVLAAMARPPQRDNIELVMNIPRDLTIVTRRRELQQVFLNLIINARAALLKKPGPRRIEFDAGPDGTVLAIDVRDNGPGIDPAIIDQIFEPFFSTCPESEDQSEGHGLGLAICREILSSMGGEITVAPTSAQGATFTVRLPLAAA